MGTGPWFSWHWVTQNAGALRSAFGEHVVLTVLAVGIGLAISFPIALLGRAHPRLQTPIFGVTGLLFAIPSLALFAMLVPITGLSTTTAEIGLVSYTLLILVRNIVAALEGVPPEVRDAAEGMGLGPRRQLLTVELPLALPGIMAGIRIATVTTVGLVTVTGLIGQGGFGHLINDGLENGFRDEVVAGAVLSVAFAAVADGLLVGAQWLLTPWSHTRRRARRAQRDTDPGRRVAADGDGARTLPAAG
ncbi:MAG TPA: ABC transporter permease [Acidimicrobiales bacterium]|nr:ABC transporter permease [Acidimicrobiales bacterium]